MKKKIAIIIFVVSVCFSNVLSYANEVIYTEEELNEAITYLRAHRDELNLTGFSIDESINGIRILAEKWTPEKEEKFKQLLDIENIEFITDYGCVADNNNPIMVRLMPKSADNAIRLWDLPIVENRVLVPIRGFLEPLGYDISWDGEKKEVTAISENNAIVFTVGEKKIKIVDETGGVKNIDIDVSPMIKNESVYVPVRFISEVSDYTVSWSESSNFVIVE